MRRRRCCCEVMLLACALVGCDELSEFGTAPDEVFRGEVVGSSSDGPDAGDSFIRQGFPSFTRMELTFDPQAVARIGPEGEAEPAGRIDTDYPCPAGRDDCEEGERVPGPLRDVALEPIESLMHDALSEYTFPGGRRIRNYILGARFASGPAEARVPRHAMVFVSLMDNGRIEVRVVAPSVRDPEGETELHPPLFGVFVLERGAR